MQSFLQNCYSLTFLLICQTLAQSITTAPFGTSLSSLSINGTIASPFWLEEIKHQGVAPFQENSLYQVFRNVQDFGAKGDGVADDTAAINAAIASGGRCKPGVCQSSTTTPAIVYFPAGTYRISAPIVDYYYTQIIGNPNSLPIIKGASNFTGIGLIDGDKYAAGGALGFNSTNVFYRQIRNVIIDTQSVPANVTVIGIHWPTAQATSLQNVGFWLSKVPGNQHTGLLIESGSGGFMGDLVFYGGAVGASLGNQQFTSRNMSFYGCQQAINQLWDWGWTYKSIKISNCKVGLNLTTGGPNAQTVGSVTFIDSSIENTPVGIFTSYSTNQSSMSNGSLILENIIFKNVRTAVQGPQNATYLSGTSSSLTIPAWGQGHMYTDRGHTSFQGPIDPFPRPSGLTTEDGKYYSRSKPSYATLPASKFLSVRSYGAKGDSLIDDTAALQRAIDAATSAGKILFVDAGIYRITKTLHIPAGSRIVGESYPLIMSSGSFFSNMHAPKAVVRVGYAGEAGCVEWSDMIVSTQGHQAGAILIEWNLSTSGVPSGMWDVHTRIGGFKGSHLQIAECPAVGVSTIPTTSNSSSPTASSYSNPTAIPSGRPSMAPNPLYGNSTGVNKACIAAFMSMHITPSASNLYMENIWLWTADHDLDSSVLNSNITIYTGRGLYLESERGNIWLVATAAEHHSHYQFQFSTTQSIFASQLQTETPYYQPHPSFNHPFPVSARWNDPICMMKGGKCDALGLRILNSWDLELYGVGLYSFYDNYNVACSQPNRENCQKSIFSIEGAQTRNINIYNLNTIGTRSMVDRDGVSLARYEDNVDVFPGTITVFRTE